MLVLSRKEGQRIQIGDDTWITVAKVKGNRVAIGVEAPKSVSIRRCELIDQTASDYPRSKRELALRDQVA